MKFIFSVIWLIIFAGHYSSQELPLKLKYYSPEFTLTDKDFQINALLKCDYSIIDSLQLQFVASGKLEVDSIKLISSDSTFLLKWKNEDLFDFNKMGYSVFLDLNDEFIKKLPFLQIAFFAKSSSSEKESYEFNYRTKFKNETTPLIYKNFITLKAGEINFYRPASVIGKALRLNKNSSFNFSFENASGNNNVALQFWFKLAGGYSTRFSLTDAEVEDTLCSFVILPRGLVKYNYAEGLIIYDDFAFSLNSWYKLTAVFQKDENKLFLFLNKNLIIEKDLQGNNLRFSILPISASIIIDDFKELEFAGKPESYIGANEKLIEFSDSLQTVYFNNFEQDSSFYNRTILSIRNADYINSDAPIFPPNPSLDIQIYSGYYLLEWEAGREAKPKEFILQRSIDGIHFDEIYSVEASGYSNNNKMQYTAAKSAAEDVIYFRIKEINQDSSEVYSNLIKVGQGEIEEFSLQQNYPNPFNPVTTITLEVYVPGYYTINVYDLVGKKILTIYSGELQAGKHRFSFDGTDYPSGIYFYEVTSPNYSQIMKMILAK